MTLVTRLSGRKSWRESDYEQCEQAKHVLHIHHLKGPRLGETSLGTARMENSAMAEDANDC